MSVLELGQVVVSGAEIQDDADFPFLLKCSRMFQWKLQLSLCAWVFTGTYCTLCSDSSAEQFESAKPVFHRLPWDHFNQL